MWKRLLIDLKTTYRALARFATLICVSMHKLQRKQNLPIAIKRHEQMNIRVFESDSEILKATLGQHVHDVVHDVPSQDVLLLVNQEFTIRPELEDTLLFACSGTDRE